MAHNSRQQDFTGGGATVSYGVSNIPPVATSVGQVYHQTSTGTQAGVLMNTWTWDGTAWFNESQPINVTRAQLIALRDASLLRQSQHYLVTDHVQNRLIAGTTILVHATADNEISESVTVNTTYDNEGWFGIYDLDRGLVLELHDNRNNVARGFSGNEVANFDWGNTFISETTVDNATWTTTYGAARTVVDLEVKELSTLITTGQTGGSLFRVNISGSSIVSTSNASVSLVNFTVTATSTVSLANFTAGSTLTNYTIKNNSSFSLTNSTIGVTLSNVLMDNNSAFAHANVTTGTVTGSGLTMVNSAQIQHNNGAGNLSLNRVEIHNLARITQSAGVVTLSDYMLDNQSSVQQAGAGTITLSMGRIDGTSLVTNNGICTINGSRYFALSQGSVNTVAGAAVNIVLNGSKMLSGSNLTVSATSTAGNISLVSCTFDGTTTISKTGTGPLSATETRFDGNSRLNTSNTRGLNISRCSFDNLVQVTQSGTGTAVDNIVDSMADTRGTYSLSSSGVNAHVVNYAKVSGLGGNLVINGTSSGQTLNRIKIDASTMNFTNNIDNTYSNCTLIDGSTANITGMTVAKTVNNMQARVGSTINITNPTTAGALTAIVADNSAIININGTAGTANTLQARNGATLTFNGGNSTRVIKELSGTLTTGNFTHNGVIVINPISVTLTAANTNRSSYLGVVSSTPLI